MRKKLEKVRNILGNTTLYKVSPDLDHRVMRALGVLPYLDSENELPEPPHVLTFITQWLMQSFKQFGAVLATIVVLVGGLFFYTQNSYSYHLNKAKVALADLQDVLEGKPSGVAWVPMALAEESQPAVDEAQVAQLSTTVVSETEKAIDIAENKTDPAVIQQALGEISAVQDETVPVLAAAAEAVTSEGATQTVAAALQTTTTDQSMVLQAQNFVATAVASGESGVAIDIQTSSEAPAVEEEAKDEEGRLEQAKSEYKDAKALIEQLKASGADAETLSKLQSKLDKVVAAFEEGKVGRAHGLSTAIAAQSKHLIREKDEEKDDDDKKDEDENNEASKEEKGQAEKAKSNLEEAAKLVEQMKADGAEQKKIDKIQSKIDEAKSALDEGKVGRAYGLSTAVLAEGKKFLEESKDEDQKVGEDEEKDDEEKDEDSDGDDEDEEVKLPISTSAPVINEGAPTSDAGTEIRREGSYGEERDSEEHDSEEGERD